MPELSFESTQIFRDALISRNLPPYSVDGSFTPPPPPYIYETELSDFSVIDQPDDLISEDPFGISLSTLNRFNQEGGLTNETVILSDLSLGPNTGEYNLNSANLFENSNEFLLSQGLNNIYSDGEGYSESYTTNVILPTPPLNLLATPNVPYWFPPSFIPSSYNPYNLLMDPLTIGSNGSLQDDSQLARDSAVSFREMMRFRLQQNIFTETAGRLNFLDAMVEPIEWISIINGNNSLIEPDNQITVPQSIVGKGLDFLGRLEGLYYPSSTIPGDYFDYNPRTENSEKTGVGKVISKIGNFFGFSRPNRNPSQLFIDNTGSGQKREIANALSRNKYRPKYVTNTAENPVGFVSRMLGVKFPDGNYYIGNEDNDVAYLTSPPGQVPLDSEGKETDTVVYGPDVISKAFEGDSAIITNEEGVLTDIVWTSDKFGDNAGFNVGKGGDVIDEDGDFPRISSEFNERRSTLNSFKEGSILDQTQKIINAQPNNANRYSHAGNAIEQISKVFNDGYKEITKGSRVIKYVTDGNVERGVEYGRIFTRDVQYSTFSKLQKKDGNIRKYSNSVLDNTYNLNIVPFNDVESTDLIKGKNVKKYLFSLENLAWRTSSKPGYRVEDLPLSERGPNGGRIMWFPPYNLSFGETISPTFREHIFLGRPEPIYTYGSTKRSGKLDWTVIVDHPSILNVIANKAISNEKDKEKINSIIESFFSGCKTYDLYELASKYPNISFSELAKMQAALNNENISPENIRDIYKSTDVNETSPYQSPQIPSTLSSFINFRFYFPTSLNSTGVDGNNSYDLYYNEYMEQINGSNLAADNFIRTNVEPSLSALNDLIKEIYYLLKSNENGVITLRFKSGPSSINSLVPGDNINDTYGALGQDKANTIKNYFMNEVISYGDETISLSDYISSGKIKFIGDTEIETEISTGFNSYDCLNSSSDNNSQNELVVMACNSGSISDISVANIENNASVPDNATDLSNVSPDITKRLIRSLFDESSYFSMLKEENPFIYEKISEKIKFFQPAFHSITPEGLNSRLTFLQQCTLPGETIPIIGINGELKQTDALNTSFGVPPVLVLRIGDFFNTKIIPTSISITHEGLDINPEGIGVQPLIAKISMSFNFIGGHGLKEPIQRLQNAISFNFYANTEVYDERAESTEDISSLLRKTIEELKNGMEVTSTPEDNKIVNDGGETIGKIGATVQSGGTETGTLSYEDIMGDQKEKIGDYFNASIEMASKMITDFNEGVFSIYMANRRYSTGTIAGKTSLLIGKSKTIYDINETNFNNFIKYIENRTLTVFQIFGTNTLDSDIRKFSDNYIRYVTKKKNNFLYSPNEIFKTFISAEEALIKTLNKTNFIYDNKFDGRIMSKDEIKGYKLMANDSNYVNFRANLTEMGKDLNDFYSEYKNNLIKSEIGSFIPSSNGFNSALGESDKMEYILFSNDILNDLPNFIDSLTIGCTDATKDNISSYYNTSISSYYKDEREQELNFLEIFKNKINKYIIYSPILPNEEKYTVPYKVSKLSSSEKKSLSELYDGNNHGNKDDYNNKINLL